MENRTDTRGGLIDKAKGRAKEAVGTVKEKTGRALGNRELEGEGILQQGEGKVDRAKGAAKETVEKAKDTVRAGVARAKDKLDRDH
ncbi:MAG TPA: CsbD family protein [Verrucomicrobiae bacterium]|nr:CsbD family protein [Verrucomicrobiae bacterium]